jgi:hypothetical protein
MKRLVITLLFALFASPVLAADELLVTASSLPTLSLYPDESTSAGMIRVKREEIPFPLEVLAKSESGRLKVKIKDVEYWVTNGMVKTNKPVMVEARCASKVGVIAVAGTRGMGEECKK